MFSNIVWSEVLVGWFPMLLLIFVWIIAMRWAMRNSRTPTGRTQIQILEDSVQESKRTNALLEKLVEDYGSRIDKLEKRRGNP